MAKTGTKWFGTLLTAFGKSKPAASKQPTSKAVHHHVVDLELKQLFEIDPESPVHIVSLREYSYATGPHWPVLRPKVMLLAETILKSLIVLGATITAREDFFVITFKSQSAAKNKQRVLEACIEVGQRLVGANFKMTSGGAAPAIGLSEVQVKDLQGPNGTIAEAVLEAAVTGAKTVSEPTMQVIETSMALETKFVSIEIKKPEVDTNWEKMERERAGGTMKLVDMKAPANKNPAPVFGSTKAKKLVWN